MCLALSALLSSPADAASTEVRIAARVLQVARVQVLSQPAQLRITSADIARGYVDVPAPVELAIRNNTGEAFLLAFESQADYVRGARVRGLDTEVQVGGAGGVVRHRALGPGMATANRTLAFRFELSPAAREGVYAWPMQVSMQPL